MAFDREDPLLKICLETENRYPRINPEDDPSMPILKVDPNKVRNEVLQKLHESSIQDCLNYIANVIRTDVYTDTEYKICFKIIDYMLDNKYITPEEIQKRLKKYYNI